VGQAIKAWEAVRPAQPLLLDPRTGERVALLFCLGANGSRATTSIRPSSPRSVARAACPGPIPGDPRVGAVDLATGQVTLIDTGANAHDVTLSPDGRVAWVTNSGFTHLPDARVHAVDVATRTVLGAITVGKYPFHSPKRGRDGNAVPPTASEMWFSDHGLRSVVAVSLAERRSSPPCPWASSRTTWPRPPTGLCSSATPHRIP